MSQRSTKRIDGVISATVGNDWITLNFESHQITLNNMQIYNAHVQSLKKRITEVEAELTKEREARWEYEKGMSDALHQVSDLARSLKWYADEMNWIQGKWMHQNTVFVTQAAEDGGTRARIILSTLEGIEPNEG